MASIKYVNPEKLKKKGDIATGNKINAYINILNFVVLMPDVTGNIGIFAFL